MSKNDLPLVTIYTDGACKGNPGPGGWGVLLLSGSLRKELCGGERLTTNNRMELQAVIEALKALKKPCSVDLHLDSEYVRKGITEWVRGWKARGWRRDDVLTIGQRQWRVLIGSGHSPEHVCLYNDQDPEQPLLLAGDQLISRISSNVPVNPTEPEANPLQDWLDSLDMLDSLSPKTWIMPAHQGVFTGLHLRTEELRHHHHHQLNTMEAQLQQTGEQTGLQIMDAIFPKLRSPIDQLLALGETIAHLHWLMHAGRVSRRYDAQAQVYRFSAGNGVPQTLYGCLALRPAHL